MKRVRQRLKELTDKLLDATNATPDEYKTYQEELKALRELIATRKALDSYIEDYGEDSDEPTERAKRVSETEWD